MLTARANQANLPGVWHQTASAEFVSYEPVGIELTIFMYSVAVMSAELKLISALWQLCYISRVR